MISKSIINLMVVEYGLRMMIITIMMLMVMVTQKKEELLYIQSPIKQGTTTRGVN
jgi:hypothetical protein